MCRSRLPGGLPALGLFVLAACSGSGDAARSSAWTVRDSAGTEIVESHAPLWGPGEAWTVSTEPVLRIGALEGEAAKQFTRLTEVLRLSDGRIVVLEAGQAEVRWFGPGGRHLVTAGGLGQGPGEFTFPFHMVRIGGDTVVVEDGIPRSQAFFGPDGDFVRQERFDEVRARELGLYRACEGLLLSDHSVLGCQDEPGPPPEWAAPGPEYERDFFRYVRVPFDVSRVDTLGVGGGIEWWMYRQGQPASHPLASRGLTAAGGEPPRVALLLNPAYSVELWTLDSGLARIVRRPDGRRSPTAEEVRETRERVAGYSREDDPDLGERLLAELPMPDSLPAGFGLIVGRDGTLWLERTPFVVDRDIHDVFDADGRWLGEVETPPDLRVHEIGDDYVLGVTHDDLGVPYVEIYDLIKGG